MKISKSNNSNLSENKNKTYLGRFIIDYENPDAGIGHSLGHINDAIKICLRHNLILAYDADQVRKSSVTSFQWKARQFIRKITLRQVYESHNIGNDISTLFAFEKYTQNKYKIESKIRSGILKTIALPKTNIKIPSNDQIDDDSYKEIDEVIRSNPSDGIVFVLPDNRTGDFEYAASREWFKKAFLYAKENYPIQKSTLNEYEKKLTVAVHIRRGDLLPGRQFEDLSKRMLPEEWYQQIIDKVIEAVQESITIFIVSEGINGQYCSENGQPYSWPHAISSEKIHVIEWIDKPFIDSFRLLVNCDVLIGSKSGMTHLAGILGDQIKLVPKMWHSYRGTNNTIELSDKLSTEELSNIFKLINDKY